MIKTILVQTAPLWDPIYVACYRLTRGHRGPIPPLRNRRRVGSAYIGRFLEAGRRIHEPLKRAMNEFAGGDFVNQPVLEFGAGVGRVLALFAPEMNKLTAVDVDASAVDYLQRTFSQVQVCQSEFDPPLPFEDNAFGIVYSVSVWTHLPPDNQRTWLVEMRRIVRPGGWVLITTSGFTALALRRQRDAEWAGVTDSQLENEGFIYKEYPQFQAGDPLNFPGIRRSYGLAAHSPAFIRANWADLFEIVEIREGVIDNVQDLVILRRPAT